MGLIQRVFDEQGLSTISLTLVKEITELIKPSGALFVEHPFGYTLGDIGDKDLQTKIILDCLRAAREITEPGTIKVLPYKWTKDDLREKQLQKNAH